MYALLARGRSPSRLLMVYTVVGLLFTFAFGVVVLVSFGGIQLHAGSSRTKAYAEIAGGLFAIAIGIGVLSGRIGGREVAESDPSGRFRQLLDRPLSFRVAALAGPATHLPGLFYLLALDLIVASKHSWPTGILDLILYNLAWFALPIAALALCIVSPHHARRAVEAIQAWTVARARTIVLTVSFLAGIALLIAGLTAV
jgi:hypothetical protein